MLLAKVKSQGLDSPSHLKQICQWQDGWLAQSGDLGRLTATLPKEGKLEEVPVFYFPLFLPDPIPGGHP